MNWKAKLLTLNDTSDLKDLLNVSVEFRDKTSKAMVVKDFNITTEGITNLVEFKSKIKDEIEKLEKLAIFSETLKNISGKDIDLN